MYKRVSVVIGALLPAFVAAGIIVAADELSDAVRFQMNDTAFCIDDSATCS